MTVRFLKMNGLGNDFVVIDARQNSAAITADVAKKIGDRHRGVGFDQLLVIEPAKDGSSAFMRIWNPDGSESGACGNGARCVADILLRETKQSSVTLSTRGGKLACVRTGEGQVSVDMGAPKLEWQDIPLAERMDTRVLDIKVGPIDNPILFGPSAVNMGNPHCVFFVDSIARFDLEKIGPMLEFHPLFPERANISLAQIMSRTEVRLRVWERGVGITQACGSAACASVVAGARKKLIERRCDVVLDGGRLSIDWRSGDDHVVMTGPIDINFSGELADHYFNGDPR